MKKNSFVNIFLPLLFILLMPLMACNKKDNNDEDEVVVTPAITAVKDFYIKANDKILSKLDSVFFSLDLTHGVIFNADSLPKGTDVSRLIPMITFANTMKTAELTFTKVNSTDTTVNYITNPNDTIDFTYPVKLDVTAADGINTYSYIIKVNVHEQVPDSMIWDNLAFTSLPSRLPDAVAQKSVELKDEIVTLIEEKDGSLTLSVSDDINSGVWNKMEVEYPFVPRIETLTAMENGLGILSESGELYTTGDAINWESTGKTWINILGCYMGSLLGIADVNGIYSHVHYPENESISDSELEEGFPIAGFTEMGIIETGWSDNNLAIIVGGEDINGNIIPDVWAFDGNVWATINDNNLPALTGASLVKYVTFRATSNDFKQIEFQAWMLMAGITSEGEYNRSVYLSIDNGVTWSKASGQLDFPEQFPDIASASAFVIGKELSASLSDNWTRSISPKPGRWYKASYTLEGDEIYWECPYIYFIGGYEAGGRLSQNIWRGVLARLTFTPLI